MKVYLSKIKIIFLSIIFMIALSSCQDKIDNYEIKKIERNELGDLNPSPGGEVSIPVINYLTLNPLYPSNSSVYYLSLLIYDSLFLYTEDGLIEPNIVEHYNLAPDKKILSLTLKEDLFWHDGDRLTTEDIVFTFELLKNSEASPYKEIFKNASGEDQIENIEQIIEFKVFDERNIDVYFSKEYANYLDMLVFPILPKHSYNYNPEEPDNFKILGSGPFKFHGYSQDNQIILKKNEQYHDRLPYIDTVNVKKYDSYDFAFLAFQTGDIDIMPLNEHDWSKYGDISNLRLEEYVTNDLDLIYFNNLKPIFQGQRGKYIKQAILRAINKKRIIDRVYLGKAIEVSVPLNTKIMAQYGLKSDVYYNVNQSLELLESIGYSKFNSDGLLINDQGETIDLAIKSNYLDKYKNVAVDFIIEDLRGIGINAYKDNPMSEKELISSIEKEAYESSLLESLGNGNYDIAYMSINLTDTPNISYILHSRSIGSGINFSYYSNPDLDNILDLLNLNLEEENTRENYLKVLEILSDDVPIIPLYMRESALIVGDKVQGPIRPIQSDVYRSFRNIFILKQFQ